MLGTIPRVAPTDPTQGFKMLQPGASATACRSGGAGTEDADLIGRALRTLLARDREATEVVNARAESTGWSIGVYGRQCVTLTGDVVRTTPTVLLPMEHGGHVHDGH
jgi:hypothetical protein